MFWRLIATTPPDKATVNVNNLTAAQSTPEGQQPTMAAATQAANPTYTVQYVMSAPQHSGEQGARNGQRGRGRGRRGRGWSPHWTPHHGPPVMATPYGFIPPYAAPCMQPPMVPQQTPFQFSPMAQTFQPQAGEQGNTTTPTQANRQFNTTATAPTASPMPEWVVCAFCGRQHDNKPCPAASSRCFRCSGVGHYARSCNVALPQ